MQGNPIHIINVSIQSADTEEDDALVTELTAYTQSKVPPPPPPLQPHHTPPRCVFCRCVVVCDGEVSSRRWLRVLTGWILSRQKALLFEYVIRRITFLIAQKVRTPRTGM